MKYSAQKPVEAKKNTLAAGLMVAAVLVTALLFIVLGQKSGSGYAWFLFTSKWPVAEDVQLSAAQPLQQGTDVVEVTLTNGTQKELYFFCENLNVQKQGEAGAWHRWHKKRSNGDPAPAQIEHVLEAGASDTVEVPMVKLLPESLQEPGTYRLHLPLRFHNSSTDEWVDTYVVLPIELVQETAAEP